MGTALAWTAVTMGTTQGKGFPGGFGVIIELLKLLKLILDM